MNFKVSILAVIIGAFGVLSTGCSDPCGDLVDKCEECGGVGCSAYEDADSDACEALLDVYENSGVTCGG
jgi:hypothetical protein